LKLEFTQSQLTSIQNFSKVRRNT